MRESTQHLGGAEVIISGVASNSRMSRGTYILGGHSRIQDLQTELLPTLSDYHLMNHI